MAGKKWLERKKSPIPETSVSPIRRDTKPVILKDKPVISAERRQPSPKPIIKPNLPPLIREPKPIINEVSPSPKEQETEINQQLIPIREKEPTREEILLTKIKNLKEQLKIVQAENKQLKTAKEQAETMANQEKEWTDNYEQQLKVVVKSLYQWKKINYYQQLEQSQVQTEQPFKPLPNFKK